MSIIAKIQEAKAQYTATHGDEPGYVYLTAAMIRQMNEEAAPHLLKDPGVRAQVEEVYGLHVVCNEHVEEPQVSAHLQLGPRELPPIVEGEPGGPYIAALALAFGMDKASMAKLITARGPIKRYAVLLEMKCRGHDEDRGREGYKDATPAALLSWLDGYRVRMGAAIIAKDSAAILNECLNVGNLAWMLAEVAGGMMAEDRPLQSV